jgi:hypothetical protein
MAYGYNYGWVGRLWLMGVGVVGDIKSCYEGWGVVYVWGI